MPTSKQSHPPVTKSAICPNCGIAQVMYDARLVDSFKEEDRKFDRRPQTNHHDHHNFLIIITFSLSQHEHHHHQPYLLVEPTIWNDTAAVCCSEPLDHLNQRSTNWNMAHIRWQRGQNFRKKIWSGDFCGPEPLDHLNKRPTKVCNCSNILVVEYLHMRQWLKKITRTDILIVFYSKCFQYFNLIDWLQHFEKMTWSYK